MYYLSQSSSRSLSVSTIIVAMFLAVSAMSCDGDSKNCTEKCSEDSECLGDLACMDTNQGSMCLPKDCRTCFDNNLNCSHTPVDDEKKGEACEFIRCN